MAVGDGDDLRLDVSIKSAPCIFPTEGASNPTYTIFATALRGAEHLAEKWGSVAG